VRARAELLTNEPVLRAVLYCTYLLITKASHEMAPLKHFYFLIVNLRWFNYYAEPVQTTRNPTTVGWGLTGGWKGPM